MSKLRFFLIIFISTTLVMVSCKKEESYNPVRIESIWTNTVDTVPHTITAAFTSNSGKATWIRIQGTGFTGLRKVIVNGFNSYINPNYVLDNSITFQLSDSIPTGPDVKVDSLLNTIQVVTVHGSATYRNFVLKNPNKMPGISSVSYTMPNVGDIIYINGNYLDNSTEVSFPNGSNARIPATILANSRTQIKVQVPAGAGSTGAIKVVNGSGDIFFSPSYMFYKSGVFMHSFKEPSVVTGSPNNVTYYNSAQIQTATGLASNPDSALSIPAAAGNVAVTTSNAWTGFFRFLANKGFQNVINKGGDITGSTSIANLAIQFDLYVNQPWKSGVLALRMDKNQGGINQVWIYNIEPWTTTAPLTFTNGWTTITIPFSNFTGLGLGTLDAYITQITTQYASGTHSLLGFVNQDINADGHTATPLTGFQLFIANLRLVPITKPTN
ncbi:MAG TPA: glycan-binding surface protein [Bacteroidales bacterium]